MIKRFTIFVFIFLIIGVTSSFAARINDLKDVQALFTKARTNISKDFGIFVSGTINIQLVDAQTLDSLYSGAYRGAEIGLYVCKNGKQTIYIMKNLPSDECYGTICHEYTHAWQTQNCPLSQELCLKEGFARYIEYYSLLNDGAYTLANNIKEQADPVYGVGLKHLFDIEKKSGIKGVVQYVKTTSKMK